MRQAHKFVDCVPNLSKFDFDNVLKCLKTNLTKSPVGEKSLHDTVERLYHDQFNNFAISGCDKKQHS